MDSTIQPTPENVENAPVQLPEKTLEQELKEFAFEHMAFKNKLSFTFRQMRIMPREARAVITNNICLADNYLFIDPPGIYVKAGRVKRLQELLAKNMTKENCSDCKDLPEGKVKKGHDHRISQNDL